MSVEILQRFIVRKIPVKWLGAIQNYELIRRVIDQLPFDNGFEDYSVLVYRNGTCRFNVKYQNSHLYFCVYNHVSGYFTKGVFSNRALGTRLKHSDKLFFNMVFFEILEQINCSDVDF